MKTVRFFVPGIPQPGGSKRGFVNKKTGHVIITEDNKRSKDWRSTVATVAASVGAGGPFLGPLMVSFEFHLPRPRGHYGSKGLRASAPKHPTVRPDCTKLVRSTEDALKAILWHDDSQIVSQVVSKVYTQLEAGAWIQVEEIEQPK